MRKLLLIGAAALAVIAPGAAQAAVIFNSTFNGLQALGTWNVHGSADGWTAVSGPGIELQNRVAGSPSTGALDDVFVELDSHSNSAMQRTIAAAGAYQLDFLYSPRPNVGSASNLIGVYLDGVALNIPGGPLTGNGGADTAWSAFTSNVFYANAGSVLKFAALGTDDSLGGYLDNIRLQNAAVPEPATWAMMLVGFFGTGSVLRRRREKIAAA